MKKYTFTIGLFDKNTEQMEMTPAEAREWLEMVLIDTFEIYAFTMYDCFGVYRMQSTGDIVREPSIRVEIASENAIPAETIIEGIKDVLNQETVMLEIADANISFI
jgi:hypothetical protein